MSRNKEASSVQPHFPSFPFWVVSTLLPILKDIELCRNSQLCTKESNWPTARKDHKMPRRNTRVGQYELYRQQLREQQLRELQMRRPLKPLPSPIDPWDSTTANELETDVAESSRFDTSIAGDFEQASGSGVAESGATKSDEQSPRILIGIDFGTTYTGLSWCVRDSLRYLQLWFSLVQKLTLICSWEPAQSGFDMRSIESWPLGECHEKIPSPIYYKDENEGRMNTGSWLGSESVADSSAVTTAFRNLSSVFALLQYLLGDSIDDPISLSLSDREQDLKDIRASFIEKGIGITHKRDWTRYRRNYSERYYERCAALHGRKNSRRAFAIPSLLGGASALSMFALDCRLQGQFDYTPPYWMMQVRNTHVWHFWQCFRGKYQSLT